MGVRKPMEFRPNASALLLIFGFFGGAGCTTTSSDALNSAPISDRRGILNFALYRCTTEKLTFDLTMHRIASETFPTWASLSIGDEETRLTYRRKDSRPDYNPPQLWFDVPTQNPVLPGSAASLQFTPTSDTRAGYQTAEIVIHSANVPIDDSFRCDAVSSSFQELPEASTADAAAKNSMHCELWDIMTLGISCVLRAAFADMAAIH